MAPKPSPVETLAHAVTAPIPEADARARFRSQHDVKLLEKEQAGESAQNLPAGLYGFSYTPYGTETPLFVNHAAQSYEVHTLAGDQIQVICFATPETVALIDSGRSTELIELFPEVVGQSNIAIGLPISRMASAKPLMRDRHNCLLVRLYGNG